MYLNLFKKVAKIDLLVIGKVLKQSLLSHTVQEVGLLIVMLRQHHVQHDVAQLVQQRRHVLGKMFICRRTKSRFSQ